MIHGNPTANPADDLDNRRTRPEIVELRRYRLRPGGRETLINLFDREFVETQEAVGIEVLGQFRDLDDPDCFVWLRAFPDMPSRAEALARFYGGPVWAAHRDEANGTMVNSDNVLLLRPASSTSLVQPAWMRPELEAKGPPAGLILCTTCHLKPGAVDDFVQFFEREMCPQLVATSATVRATFVTEEGLNTFPHLPVRQGENVFVWLCSFPDVRSYATHVGRLAESRDWTSKIIPEMARRTWRENDEARLAPTARSLLR